MQGIEGKVVIITGASGSIGKSTVNKFLDLGAKVLASDYDHEGLKTLKNDLSSDHLETVQCDVSDPKDIKQMFDTCIETFGRVDVLVNNAGTEGKVAPVEEQKLEDYEKVMDVNVKGIFVALQHAFPLMEQNGGSIINISSVAGLRGSASVTPYITSKHAVTGLTKAAALEGGPKGIRVNSVHPSPVDNRMMRSLEEGFAPGQAEAVKQNMEQSIPLGRYAKNEEVADLIVFLASEHASFINGVQYRVDGGMGAS